MQTNIIYNQDCLEILPTLPDGSIDLIATDPPYGISFMGKDWDTFNEMVPPQGAYQHKKGFKKLPRQNTISMAEFFVPVWRECLRVLKPGAFTFVMCSPRADVMSKQVICLQEAGFEVGFTPIFWAMASGFPKAQNIGKAVDKRLGVKRKVVGRQNVDIGIQSGSMHAGRESHVVSRDRTIATAPEAQALDGSYAGFQPKPAVEVILVAMKPLSEKTYVDQALKNQKGITWLDDGRIPYESEGDKAEARPQGRATSKIGALAGGTQNERERNEFNFTQQGRFPANLLCSDDVLNDGRIDKGTKPHKVFSHIDKYEGYGNITRKQGEVVNYGDSGSFSRYFDLDKWWREKIKQLPESVQKTFPFLIVPKASKSEKNRGVKDTEGELGHNRFDQCAKCGGYILQNPNRPSACKCDAPIRIHNKVKGNYHPTVKPLKLMSYLITLGSREGDIVLDPFIGTGTTAIAAQMLGRNFIGIEISAQYYGIARARLNSARQLMLGHFLPETSTSDVATIRRLSEKST